jgi:purine-binding chemotaxis protein CheW
MSGEQVNLLLVRALHVTCALRLETVAEVMRTLPLRKLNGLPPYVLGASVIRAEPTPIIDLSVLLGNERLAAPARYVLLRGPSSVALAVDSVDGVRLESRSRLGSLPRLLASCSSDHISSIGALDGELLPVLASAIVLPEGMNEAVDFSEQPAPERDA